MATMVILGYGVTNSFYWEMLRKVSGTIFYMNAPSFVKYLQPANGIYIICKSNMFSFLWLINSQITFNSSVFNQMTLGYFSRAGVKIYLQQLLFATCPWNSSNPPQETESRRSRGFPHFFSHQEYISGREKIGMANCLELVVWAVIDWIYDWGQSESLLDSAANERRAFILIWSFSSGSYCGKVEFQVCPICLNFSVK